MVIGFKENGKFLLKTGQTLTLVLVYFWPSFKCFLFLILTKGPDHKVYTLAELDYSTWLITIILLCTTFLNFCLAFAFLPFLEKEIENTSLNDVRVETDEERRPLFEPKENYGDNITNNDKHVHGQACQCLRFSCQSNFVV